MPCLVEIGSVVLENKIFKYFYIILLFRYYLPLEKGVALHLNKFEFPPPKDALCKVWLKLAQWFWRRSWKCEKFTDRQRIDSRRSEKLIWAFSSGELQRRCFSEISRTECFPSDRYISSFFIWNMYTKNSTLKVFYQFILIYRVNTGKKAILNKNIGIIGHFLKDRDFIGNIWNKGMLEGL